MNMEGLFEIIFLLVILGFSALVVLAQKATAKRTRERFLREEEMKRQRQMEQQQAGTPPAHQPQQQQAPYRMTQEEAYAQQAGERYAEAVIPEISRETGPMPGPARLPSEPVWVEEATPAITNLNAELAAKWGAEAPSRQIQTGPTFARFIKSDAKTAIVMNEILGPPLAEKPPR